MSRKAIIILVIIVIVIIIGVVGFLIYKKSKDRNSSQAAIDAEMLRQQLAQNPNMPQDQRSNILAQLAILAEQLRAAKGQGTYVPGYGTPTYGPEPAPTQTAPYGFPLKQGSSGSYVASLQNAINAKCGTKLIADGKFGPLTSNAAKSCLKTPDVDWEYYKALGLA